MWFESLLFGWVSLHRSLVAALATPLPTLLACRLPRFLPALIAHAIAQGQHRIHVGALPAHSCAFETGFDHELVGTLHHPRADRPASASKGGIVHQTETFAPIPQMLSTRFLQGFSLAQAISHGC